MRTVGKKHKNSCFPSSSYTLKRCSFFKTDTKLIYFVILCSPLSNSLVHHIVTVLFYFCLVTSGNFFVRLSFFITYKTTALHRFEKHYMTAILCQSRAQTSDGSAKILERSKIPIEYTVQPCIVRENNDMCTNVSRTAAHAFPESLGSILQ